MYKPTKSEFLKKAKRYNLIPVYREMVADLETPVSAYMKLGGDDFSFLLESVEGGESTSRYSFLGSNPEIVFKSKGREVDILYHNNEESFIAKGSALDVLKEFMIRYNPVIDPALPRFLGGAVGYMSYDMVRDFEELPDANPDTINLPDLFFMITDTLIAFDHLKHKLILISNAHVRDDPGKAYDEAIHKLEILHEKLRRPLKRKEEKAKQIKSPQRKKSTFTKQKFEKVVDKSKEYILAGDIFQVVLSQRIEKNFTCDSFDIYRALRMINPSPYMYYLKFGGLKLIGTSPEILVRCEDGKVVVRPIAGTRKRGATPEEDKALEEELADPKERAEHLMLVDLGRNDVGRVSEFGTVRVKEEDLMFIERYSHVMHIVSNVEGRLKKGLDSYDVLKACFPAGTVSGAPKIRSMEIIDELEPTQRAPYAGAVGYFSFNGNLDSCIIIRTILVKDSTAYIQAGAGIVADSVPSNEWHETLNKAKGMLKAIDLAEEGLL